MNEFYKTFETESYVCYKVRKALFAEEKYQSVSTDAKMLYGLLLDRMHLSVKNGWVDKYSTIYQFFTVRETQEKLRLKHEKICKLFSKLEQAVSMMVSANLHRENILPSERAFAYKMKLEAISRQGQRNNLTSSQLATKYRSDEKIAEEFGVGKNALHRYIRLT